MYLCDYKSELNPAILLIIDQGVRCSLMNFRVFSSVNINDREASQMNCGNGRPITTQTSNNMQLRSALMHINWSLFVRIMTEGDTTDEKIFCVKMVLHNLSLGIKARANDHC